MTQLSVIVEQEVVEWISSHPASGIDVFLDPCVDRRRCRRQYMLTLGAYLGMSAGQ